MSQFSLRKYGRPPYRVAVVHGGPGAPGSVAPVARELSRRRGVLEPLQTANSIEGQIEELRHALIEQASLPVILIGHSWGAMLGYLLTAYYPELVSKLIMVGSGVFEERYTQAISETRLARLKPADALRLHDLLFNLNSGKFPDKSTTLNELSTLFAKTDCYDPITTDLELIDIQQNIYRKVWPELVSLRESGELLHLGKRIKCPVTAIHGDYDPHPFEGVQIPLSSVLKRFNFVLLEYCGHYPWIERKLKEQFFSILRKELR